MDTSVLEQRMKELGARVIINNNNMLRKDQAPITMNVRTDNKGEHFVMNVNQHKKENGIDLQVLDFSKPLIQMLVMVKEPIIRDGKIVDYRNNKLLCGHDERHWYVASVKEEAVNIKSAFESLKPAPVLEVQKKKRLRANKRNKRHNPAFKRQGEWFFIPIDFEPEYNPYEIHRNEPIQRVGGSPHRVEEVLRYGGEKVYVYLGKKVYSEKEYEAFMKTNPMNVSSRPIRQSDFVIRYRNARVLGRGTVRHRDHKTLHLKGWHEIHLSTESRTNVNSFLD